MPASQKITDLVYKRVEGKSLLLDLQLPAGASQPVPLVIWIHGGGWRMGSKDEPQSPRVVADTLFERGYAIASINYRLSNEAIFPAQLEDCKAAVRWLRAHAGDYGYDPDHIGVWGYSAGAHLSALLGTTGDHAEFDVGDHLDCSSRVQAVGAFATPTDFATMGGYHDAPDSPESRLIGAPVLESPALVVRANPITYVSKNSAPFLLFHGDQDTIVIPSQSQKLLDALVGAGVDATLYVIEGGDHGMSIFSQTESERIVEKACAFFDQHLRA